ncbi:MAG TPA: VirB3 family type IV secretion system protein, partial [Burkholderiaceae bacterium]|nr:VirB3 family type IV secretion system protein [Burkholderiaceae bacterium]
MSTAQDLHTDVLFVGLTRPATLWGIPLVAFVIEFMTTVLIFLAVGNPLYLLLAA